MHVNLFVHVMPHLRTTPWIEKSSQGNIMTLLGGPMEGPMEDAEYASCIDRELTDEVTAKLREEIHDLKVALYARFGKSIKRTISSRYNLFIMFLSIQHFSCNHFQSLFCHRPSSLSVSYHIIHMRPMRVALSSQASHPRWKGWV